MKEIHVVSLCNENAEQIQQAVQKIDVWFDHFQMEFDLHIWWLSSPHEYFKMIEYEGDNVAHLQVGEQEIVYFCIKV